MANLSSPKLNAVTQLSQATEDLLKAVDAMTVAVSNYEDWDNLGTFADADFVGTELDHLDVASLKVAKNRFKSQILPEVSAANRKTLLRIIRSY